MLSRGPDAELPRGSTIEAVIDRSIFLEADKVQFTAPGQASTLAGPSESRACAKQNSILEFGRIRRSVAKLGVSRPSEPVVSESRIAAVSRLRRQMLCRPE